MEKLDPSPCSKHRESEREERESCADLNPIHRLADTYSNKCPSCSAKEEQRLNAGVEDDGEPPRKKRC